MTGSSDRRSRIPPGQHEISDYPVLSAGPTPHTPLDQWTFTLEGLVDQAVSWGWQDFTALPAQDFVVDISCVTKWTHLDMRWRGVSLDVLLEHVRLDPRAAFAIAYQRRRLHHQPADSGHRERPVVHRLGLRRGAARATPRRPGAHGRAAPLLLEEREVDPRHPLRGAATSPGFWESLGYNNHGDPWKEERYSGD